LAEVDGLGDTLAELAAATGSGATGTVTAGTFGYEFPLSCPMFGYSRIIFPVTVLRQLGQVFFLCKIK